MVSKQSKSLATYVRPSSPPTRSVIVPCGVKGDKKSLFKTQVESIVGQISNPLKYITKESAEEKLGKKATEAVNDYLTE